MKRLIFAGLVLFLVVSFGHAQGAGTADAQKGRISQAQDMRNVMQKMSAVTGKMGDLIKEITPKKMQDTADMMEKLAEDVKDLSKKMKKGTAEYKEFRKMFEDMKDMTRKMKKGAATAKELKVLNDKMIKMQKKYKP